MNISLDHLFLNFSRFTVELPILEPLLNLLIKLMNFAGHVSELSIFFFEMNLFAGASFSELLINHR